MQQELKNVARSIHVCLTTHTRASRFGNSVGLRGKWSSQDNERISDDCVVRSCYAAATQYNAVFAASVACVVDDIW